MPEDRQEVANRLGHGIEAFNTVPTVIFAFLAHLWDFVSTVIHAVSLGGDTDTIASMAEAIAGGNKGIFKIEAPFGALSQISEFKGFIYLIVRCFESQRHCGGS